ncbi:MAG: hypothetical protein QNJ42_10465 [Crocosphaera sp.]|nr:hypothetical protein [Crocosphaera sp.]
MPKGKKKRTTQKKIEKKRKEILNNSQRQVEVREPLLWPKSSSNRARSRDKMYPRTIPHPTDIKSDGSNIIPLANNLQSNVLHTTKSERRQPSFYTSDGRIRIQHNYGATLEPVDEKRNQIRLFFETSNERDEIHEMIENNNYNEKEMIDLINKKKLKLTPFEGAIQLEVEHSKVDHQNDEGYQFTRGDLASVHSSGGQVELYNPSPAEKESHRNLIEKALRTINNSNQLRKREDGVGAAFRTISENEYEILQYDLKEGSKSLQEYTTVLQLNNVTQQDIDVLTQFFTEDVMSATFTSEYHEHLMQNLQALRAALPSPMQPSLGFFADTAGTDSDFDDGLGAAEPRFSPQS